MKYSEGNYLIVGFDPLGNKLWTKIAKKQCHLGAIDEGEECIETKDCASYVTLRVQHNSKTKEQLAWEARE
jgi:hypothetical protein